MATSNETQIIRPGAGFVLESLFGPSFSYGTDWFNSPAGEDLINRMRGGGSGGGFDPVVSSEFLRRAQTGNFFDPNDPTRGGTVAGYNFGDTIGKLQANRDTFGTQADLLAHPEGNWGWLKESGKWLGYDPETGANSPYGALGTIDQMYRTDYGGQTPLIFSDVGLSWDAAKRAYDQNGNIANNPAAASQGLWGEYRGQIENSGSNPQGDWWTGQTRVNTDRQGPAGTWANNLGQTHAGRIYGVETTGPQQDDIGRRGFDQQQLLTNPYEARLLADIDRENATNLTDQLGGVRNSLASAGLGDSGTGRRSMLDTYRRAQEQGQRDKMRTMADIRDRNIQRQSDALTNWTNIGAQAAADRKSRLAQANTDWTNLAMQGRQTEQAQDYDAYMRGQLARQDWLKDTSNLSLGLMGDLYKQQGAQDYGILQQDAEMIKAASGEQRAWQQMENQQRQAAVQQNMGLWAQNTGMRNQAFDRQQQYADLERQLQQMRANAIGQYSMTPMDTLIKIATGIQSQPDRGQQAPSFFRQLGQSYGNGLAGSLGNETYSMFASDRVS